MKTPTLYKQLFRATRGASLTDYGLLVGLIALLAVASVSALGSRVDFVFRVAEQEIWMAMNEEANFLENGDFDNTEGMFQQSWGFASPELDGWISNNGLDFELHQSGYQGMNSVNGDFWLDMGESPGPMNISQRVGGLIFGRIYAVAIYAGDRSSGLNNLTLVFWNGDLIGELKADQQDVMQEYRFHVQAGAGDSSDILTLMEVSEGPTDSDGMSLDFVRIWGR